MRLRVLVRLELHVDHGDGPGAVGVQQIARQEPALGGLDAPQWVAEQAAGREERLGHEAHRGADVADPAGALLLALGTIGGLHAEVVAAAMGEELHLEDLEGAELLTQELEMG